VDQLSNLYIVKKAQNVPFLLRFSGKRIQNIGTKKINLVGNGAVLLEVVRNSEDWWQYSVNSPV